VVEICDTGERDCEFVMLCRQVELLQQQVVLSTDVFFPSKKAQKLSNFEIYHKNKRNISIV